MGVVSRGGQGRGVVSGVRKILLGEKAVRYPTVPDVQNLAA